MTPDKSSINNKQKYLYKYVRMYNKRSMTKTRLNKWSQLYTYHICIYLPTYEYLYENEYLKHRLLNT